MEGGTEFRFVDGIRLALEQATEAAGGQDVRLGGGVSAIRQYLQAGLVAEIPTATPPAPLGPGEHPPPASTSPPSATSSPSTFRVPARRTSSWRGTDRASLADARVSQDRIQPLRAHDDP